MACLALHHIPDLTAALDRSVRLLGPGGRLLVVEYGWDRIDQATARWCWRHLPADHSPEGQGFLRSCCQQWRQGQGAGGADPFEVYRDRWARSQAMHDSATMLGELHARYAARLVAWGPYLYADLDATEADEQASIDRGEIQAILLVVSNRPATLARADQVITLDHGRGARPAASARENAYDNSWIRRQAVPT